MHESALAGVRGARPTRIRVIQALQVPAAVSGKSRDRICSRRHQLPQILGASYPARESAAHGHDYDRILAVLLQLANTPASLPQVSGYQLEVIAQLIFICQLASPFSRSRTWRNLTFPWTGPHLPICFLRVGRAQDRLNGEILTGGQGDYGCHKEWRIVSVIPGRESVRTWAAPFTVVTYSRKQICQP
jgi:hypothetical protein